MFAYYKIVFVVTFLDVKVKSKSKTINAFENKTQVFFLTKIKL